MPGAGTKTSSTMSDSQVSPSLRIESIFHPSDFSAASEAAFAHALKIALVTRARLRMLHVSDSPDADWHDFPGVRDTLVRWGLLTQESPRGAVAQLGIDVRKVISEGPDPVRASLTFLENHPADLIVLAVHAHEGRMRWLHRPVGEPIARDSGLMTLFLPQGASGFVSLQDGSVSLRRILIPIASKPRPQPAIEAVHRLVRQLDAPAGQVTLLHVGAPGEAPAVHPPADSRWTWETVTRPGDPVPVILETASNQQADLIVMTTDGPDGFLDGLRGTTSERVLRQTRCPVLILPAGTLRI